MVTTVEKIMEMYTKIYRTANLARKIEQAIGHLSTTVFIKMNERGDVKYCLVNKANIYVAEAIYGPEDGSLNRKMSKRKRIC